MRPAILATPPTGFGDTLHIRRCRRGSALYWFGTQLSMEAGWVEPDAEAFEPHHGTDLLQV
jgi:hypothetical protein